MKHSRHIWIFLLWMPAALPGATRETLTAPFAQANALYQQGNFAEAEQQYRQILGKGAESGTLFYNLGNACFKQNKLGEAIYFWEKADRLIPGDRDVQENLALAALMVVDRIEVPPDPLPLRLLDRAVHGLTITQESRIILVLFLAVNALITVQILAKSPAVALRSLLGSLLSGLIMVLFACSLAWKVYETNYRPEGVVIEQKADVRSGPGMENITVFTVHEGILLRIRGESGGWYQVSLPNGWSGWLQKDFVRRL